MRLRRHRLQIKKNTRRAVHKRKNRFSCNTGGCLCKKLQITNYEFPQIWKHFLINNQLIDGVVRCSDGKEFKIHRVILSAASPYFRALFTNSINRCNVEIYETNVAAPGKIFKLLLDYAYVGTCRINKINVRPLLIYADQYGILGVVQKCCDFLINDLNVKNCLEIFMFATDYFCCNLMTKTYKYVLKNIMRIIDKNKDFVQLSVEKLFNFLNDDELNIRNEQDILKIIEKWMSYGKDEKKMHLVQLLKCIRFGCIETDDILEILQHPLIQNQKDCCEYVTETNDLIQRSLDGQISNLMIDYQMFRNRISQDLIFAIGGWNIGRPTNHIETYNLCTDKWLISSHSEYIPRAYHGICIMKHFIYIIGGFDGNQYFNTVRKYDPITYKWSDCACMYDHRCYVSVVACDNRIYAMGGYNGRIRLKSFERYDPERNQWEIMPPMYKPRSDAGAAILDNKIYIVGGFSGQEIMRSGEVFDIKHNQWSYIPEMLSPRSGVSLVAYNKTLYVFGGFNGEIRMKSCEKYLPAYSNKGWSPISDMITCRSNFATATLDDLIFVIGGFNGITTTDFVEYYNPKLDYWYEAASMNLTRSALSAVVVSDLPNIRAYSYETYNVLFQ